MANLPLSGLPQGTTLENNATIVTVQTVGSTVVNQRIPKSLFFSQALAGALVAANNLSDIANAAIALSNLGVHNLNYSSGTTAPATALGNVGDFAFNDNFEWYEKTAAATWTLRVNAVTTSEMTTAITTATTGLLTQTVADTRYAPLGESPGSGARYTFNASTTLTSIASGEIRFSSGTPASVTSIAIHESDRNGAPMATILDTIGNGAKLQIAFDANEESYCWFNVTAITDNGAYRTYTVTYLGTGTGAIAAGEVTLGIFGAASAAASGGATGIQYTYSNTVGTPTAGQIRSANIASPGTISISATDAQSQSVSDVLSRVKIGAIVAIAKDSNNQVRGTVTTAYTAGTNSFDISPVYSYGTIANGNTIYFSIVSDAPSVGSGGISFTESVAATVVPSVNTGVISNTSARQTIVLATGSNPDINAVQGKGTGGWQFDANGSLIVLPDGTSNTGLRNDVTLGRYASAELLRIDSSTWVVNKTNALSALELFAVAGSTYDPSSTAIFNAVTSAGGSLTALQKGNIDTVILGLKSNSQSKWSKVLGLYMFIGTTADTQAINAKSPGNNTLTYTGTGTHAASGYQVNGSNQYANTGILPPASRRGGLSLSFSGMGTGTVAGAIASNGNQFYVTRTTTTMYSALDTATETSQTGIASATTGSLAALRNSDSQYKTFRNGVLSNTITSTANTASQDRPIILGGLTGGVSLASTTFSMVTIFENFTDTELSELYALEDAYRLSR